MSTWAIPVMWASMGHRRLWPPIAPLSTTRDLNRPGGAARMAAPIPHPGSTKMCVRALRRLIALAAAVLLFASITRADDSDKTKVVVLIPTALKAYKDKIYPGLPFIRSLADGGDNLKAQVVVGTLDAVKKHPDTRFVFAVGKHTFVPAPLGVGAANHFGFTLY